MSNSITTTRTKPDTMTGRVEQFFKDNPDEELTYSLMAKKWDLTRMQVAQIVKTLTGRGVLESVHVIRNRQKGIAHD